MSDQASTAPRQRLPLAQQIEKLERILAERASFYRRAHEKGQMTTATRIEKDAELADIRASFQFLADNAEWIRTEAQRRRIVAEQQRELDEIEKRDDVQDLRRTVEGAFPGATSRITSQPDSEAA